MAFSPGQQARYRPLVDAAWRRQCESTGDDPADKDARRAWYETELANAIGLTSTVSADRTFDFQIAIAHFEMLAESEGHYWREALRPALLRAIRKLSGAHDVTPDYCEAIAAQANRLDHRPPLETLHKDDFRRIITSLKRDAARRRS